MTEATAQALVKTQDNTIQVVEVLPKLNLLVGQHLYKSQFVSIIDEQNLDRSFVDILQDSNPGIYYADNGYYMFVAGTKNTEMYIRRMTNWTGYLMNLVISKNFNSQNSQEYKYNVEFLINSKKVDITLSQDILMNSRKFESKMSEYAHVLSVMDEKQHKNIIARILSRSIENSPTIEYKTAGLNFFDDELIFTTADNYYCYGKHDKALSKKIKLSSDSILQPQFAKYSDICIDVNLKKRVNEIYNLCPEKIVSQIVLLLIDTLEKAYNGKIEAFIVIGMCFMTLFLKQISNDFEGTPIVALYGEAASGKSNLLRLCANVFGLDKSILHGGMDTMAGIIEDLENYVNIALLVDEVELNGIEEIKRLIKAVYGQTGRKKYNVKNNINTTIFFNTNNEFLYDLEYKNRCIEVNFVQTDFNAHEAEKFNQFQKYLSYVSQYIIENVQYENVKNMIVSVEKSEQLAIIKDKRIKRNISIAITGLNLIISLVDTQTLIGKDYFDERINNYIAETLALLDNDDIGRFLTIFMDLVDKKYGKLHNTEDYKLENDGVHILTGKYGKRFEMLFNKSYTHYFKGAKPLKFKDYQKLLKSNGAEMKVLYYSKIMESRYGIFLSFDKFPMLSYLADRKAKQEEEAKVYYAPF